MSVGSSNQKLFVSVLSLEASGELLSSLHGLWEVGRQQKLRTGRRLWPAGENTVKQS